ncbi:MULTISPECIES: hypothetical protein [unclassified Halomonas]|uniref:hypothetical protein n=1 Tax=unclassified Halomonas TaxID=2609666 RepID=UPI0020A1152C|nr:MULTISPECIES: hypothetical protein [unclassified Halomonas]MCP1314057.1 hypothetical protein [Halomonas sp. 707D7]MCP1325926.1 hypothetical protein [Halomonas sp. 707D4]
MTRFAVYRAVKEDAAIDAEPEWWVVDTREEVPLVHQRVATKPEADEVVARLNDEDDQ